MTATDFALAADRPSGGQAALWLSAAAVALAVHGGAAYLALQTPPPPPAEGAPTAVMIELAPAPAAPEAVEDLVGEDVTEAPEILESTTEPMLEPPPPDLTQPMEDLPDLAPPPAPLTAPPAELPEVALPAPTETTAPIARPRDLAVLEPPPEPVKQVERQEPKPERKEPPQKEPPQEARTQASAVTQQAAAAPKASANARSGAGGVSPARWQARLMAHLERHHRYPSGARSRREQGTVLMTFTMDEAGNITSSRMARSSGSAELDEAAKSLMRRASPVPAPPPGAPRSITVPVVFNIR